MNHVWFFFFSTHKEDFICLKLKAAYFLFVCLFLVENLNRALPELHQQIELVEALSKRAPPGGNMTESIWRIKDVIEETRNYINGVMNIFFQEKKRFIWFI